VGFVPIYRCRRSSSRQFLRPQLSTITSVSADRIPLLHLKRRMGTQWEYDPNLTRVYFGVLHKIATSATRMRLSPVLAGLHLHRQYYQGIFQRFGSRGSALTVVPFNQGPQQDEEALVDYIYMTFASISTISSPSLPFLRTIVRLMVLTTSLNCRTI
jgi:fatty acid synthase subunit alpha, fungi type